jgi:chromosome segregation ATPase
MTSERIDFKTTLGNAKSEFVALQQELGECLARQEELEKKLAAVRQMIYSFSNVLGETFDEADELGLTEAVRQAFKSSSSAMSALQVKGRMVDLGFDIAKYGNIMAAVHTVIGRLVKQSEIMQNGTDGAGKPCYQSIPKMAPPPGTIKILTPDGIVHDVSKK